MNEGLLLSVSKILHNTNPGEKRTNQYFYGLPIGKQCDLYKALQSLYELLNC